MHWVILIPPTEIGYRKLREHIFKHPTRYYLPIPFEVCVKDTVLFYTYIPLSLVRIWGEILDLIWNGSNDFEIVCYKNMRNINATIDLSVKISSLVIKASAYGKIDIKEWIELFKDTSLNPPLRSWSGVLVLDKYLEYYALVKNNIRIDRIIQLGPFIPTPIETLFIVTWRKYMAKEEIKECDISEIIKYVIEYIRNIVLYSNEFSTTYAKIIKDKRYLDIIEKCIDIEILIDDVNY
ncbi:MAG: hypothetical protein QXP02_00195 [Desulfurococcaceae archaeon]